MRLKLPLVGKAAFCNKVLHLGFVYTFINHADEICGYSQPHMIKISCALLVFLDLQGQQADPLQSCEFLDNFLSFPAFRVLGVFPASLLGVSFSHFRQTFIILPALLPLPCLLPLLLLQKRRDLVIHSCGVTDQLVTFGEHEFLSRYSGLVPAVLKYLEALFSCYRNLKSVSYQVSKYHRDHKNCPKLLNLALRINLLNSFSGDKVWKGQVRSVSGW